MKSRLSLIAVILAGIAVMRAEDVTIRLDRLVTSGNIAYENSQRRAIKECADSIAGLLSQSDLVDDALKDYTVSLYKLRGNCHYESAAFDSAKVWYDRAQRIMDDNPNTSFHGNRLLIPRERAQLQYRQSRWDEAVATMEYVDSLLDYNQSYLPGDNNWLITRMTYAMCLARVKRFNEALAIADTELREAIDKNSQEYVKALRMAGKIRLLADADRSGALRAYRNYFARQKEFTLANLAKMNAREREDYWQTLRPFIADCYLLEDADPGFLYDVTLFAKGLLLQLSRLGGDGPATAEALATLGYRWPDIRRKLRSGQAAIEFIQYEKEGRQAMAALLLRAGGKPQFIAMPDTERLLTLAGESLRSTNRADKDTLYSDGMISRIAWPDNLLHALEGISRVYFAPDGYQHRLAIEYMPQVADKRLYRLTSTRRLMESPSAADGNTAMLLVGDINFNLAAKNSADSVANDSAAYSNYLGRRFPRLDRSTDETRDIYSLRNNDADSLVISSDATEYTFRSLAPSYSSILVSTHGDFSTDSPVATDIKPIADDRSMSESVIALAGVNGNLRDTGFDPSTQYDGLLSARELSGLDLSGCRLFTVSACQSALGEISSDGVYGLQRGLKNAGVDAMVVSLWNVNSDATARFMRRFYSNLDDGLTLHEAFNAARDYLINQSGKPDGAPGRRYKFNPATMSGRYEATSKPADYSSPGFSDAFILIDAIE